MKKLTVFLFLIFVVSLTHSQTYSVSGRVMDKTRNTPLHNANVFINNSSKGTVTDQQGGFSIHGLAPGKYELIISFVGFKTVLQPVEITGSSQEINTALEKKETILREVLILDDPTRRKYLEIFKQNLLGFTSSAKRCTIRNLSEVGFTIGPDKGSILAYADEDLVIDNPDLGYVMHFQLTDFYFNNSSGTSWFFGYLRFEDLALNGDPSKKWTRRRQDNYYGSTMHFYRSLVKREMASEGYKITERRVVQVDSSAAKHQGVNANNVMVTFSPKMLTHVSTVPVNEDSLLKIYSDSAYKIYEIKIKGTLNIVYKKNTKLKNDIRPAFGQPASGTFTGLRLREAPMLVDYKGVVLTPANIYYDGMWVYERLANLLPEDYEPEK